MPELSCAPAGVCTRLVFTGLLVGQLPFNTFNPGPAYNGIGADAVISSFTAAVIAPGVVCLTLHISATDGFIYVDQKIRTPTFMSTT